MKKCVEFIEKYRSPHSGNAHYYVTLTYLYLTSTMSKAEVQTEVQKLLCIFSPVKVRTYSPDG